MRRDVVVPTGRELAAGDRPNPPDFVSVADKGLSIFVSLLDATLMGWLASVASKELNGAGLVPTGPK